MLLVTIYCYLFCVFFPSSYLLKELHVTGRKESKASCASGDYVCELARISFDVFKELHDEIDDDKDGGLDPKEAKNFVREELNYMEVNSRASKFSKYDQHISMDELWSNWQKSDVFKWTVDDVLTWLETEVQLPQYKERIILHKVDGQSLPKLAMKNFYFLTHVLKIPNSIDRQKIRLKVVDLILFGTPKNGLGHIKDIFLSSCLAFTISLSFLGYQKYRDSEKCLRQLSLELDSLTESENSLKTLTSKLKKLEHRAQASKIETENLKREYENEIFATKLKAHNLSLERRKADEKKEQLRLAQQELAYTKSMLEKTERMQQSQLTSENMLLLLQLSFEMEMRFFQETSNFSKKFISGRKCSEGDDKSDQELSVLVERWNKIEALTGLTLFPTPGIEKLRHLIDTTMKAESRRFFGKPSFKMPFPEPLPTVRELDVDEGEGSRGGRPKDLGPRLARRHVLTRASTVQNIRANEPTPSLTASSSCSAINTLERTESTETPSPSSGSSPVDGEKAKKKRKFFRRPSFSKSFKNKN